LNDAQVLRLPGLRLLCRIAAGRLGEVWLAVRESDGQPVAVKVLQLGAHVTPAHLAQLVREHALLAGIHHPNVIRLHEAGQAGDRAWLTMEYFERGDLRGELGHGLPRERVLAVATQLASALQAIHDAGIAHGDLKPQNVLLRTDGSVVLSDFGIARALRGPAAGAPPLPPEQVGTPFYLSPEQARGEPVVPASDLYSLGVMLFEMLAGERPYAAESLEQLLQQHQAAPTPPLPPAVREWQPIVERLMAKRPAQRYAGAGDLLADLQRLGH
jgi:serine/threonine protein kinase